MPSFHKYPSPKIERSDAHAKHWQYLTLKSIVLIVADPKTVTIKTAIISFPVI
jgi:hypothetical protein